MNTFSQMDGRIQSILFTQLRRAQKREGGLKNLLGETEAQLQVRGLFDSGFIWSRNLTFLKLRSSPLNTDINSGLAPSLLRQYICYLLLNYFVSKGLTSKESVMPFRWESERENLAHRSNNSINLTSLYHYESFYEISTP